ncbi:MAG: UbiA family prenyltransferase [Candidatus ainarchaeum sp.]|nr:UbiA family prenyltransferase [Candidatus ainarchaeum sp.]
MDFLSKLKKAFWISRPLFWIGPVAAYKAGLWAAGIPTGPLEWLELIILAFPISLIIYGMNDIYDREADRKNPRKRSIIWGMRIQDEDVPWIRNWCLFSAIAMVLAAATTLNPLHVLFAVLGAAFAYSYSAPPLRLKERPIIDSLSAMGYGLFPFGLAYSLGGSIFFMDWRVLVLLLNLPAVHAISTIMDMEGDRKAGVNTFAARYGGRAPALFAAAIFSLNAAMFAFFSCIAPTISLIAAGSMAIFMLISLGVASFPTPKNAKLAFKLLIAYCAVWGYFLILHYFLLGSHFLQGEFTQALPQLLRS